MRPEDTPDRRRPEVSNNKLEIGVEVGRAGQRHSADSWRYRGFPFFHVCRFVLVRYELTVGRVF